MDNGLIFPYLLWIVAGTEKAKPAGRWLPVEAFKVMRSGENVLS
jgi:hypothetical protein